MKPGSAFAGMVNLLLLTALILVAWQAAHLLAGRTAVASPASTVLRLWDLAGTATFWVNVRATAAAFGIAAAVSASLGIAIGIPLGLSPFAREAVEPVVMTIYSLPKITLYPVILLIFGFGLSAKVALGVLHGVVPIIVFTMTAISGISPVYFKAARVMKLITAQTVRSIYLRAALPGIATGLRVGLSLTLFGTLIGEMFASTFGLGSLLMASIETVQVETILAIALILSVFAILMNAALLWLNKRLTHQ